MLLQYFLLVFILSIPFWLIGGNRLPLPVTLPGSALIVFNPLIAASILMYQKDGFDGVKVLLKKAFDAHKIQNKTWYVPIFLLMPFIYFSAYVIMRLTGLPLPEEPDFPLLAVPVFFLGFFISATGEELGWTGFAIDPMQNRWGALKAGILLGFVWSLWHIIGDLQADRTVDWIVWHRLSAVALRILIVWIYNNTGKSVFAAILIHAMDNVSWALFPNYGTHYNPFIVGLISWLIASIVIFIWGSKTLNRFRFAGSSRIS